nr:MAG TPA: hypothetical protein [Bacteriophage sp.]
MHPRYPRGITARSTFIRLIKSTYRKPACTSKSSIIFTNSITTIMIM